MSLLIRDSCSSSTQKPLTHAIVGDGGRADHSLKGGQVPARPGKLCLFLVSTSLGVRKKWDGLSLPPCSQRRRVVRRGQCVRDAHGRHPSASAPASPQRRSTHARASLCYSMGTKRRGARL